MDETRLKKIEDEYAGDFHPCVVPVKELISSLRDAWRERDEAQGHAYDIESGEVYLKLKARVARAEAELARLKHPTVTVSWKGGQETLPLDKVVFHIERFQAVREAAEAYLNSASPHVHNQVGVIDEEETLRRTLDVVKDPVR